MPESSSLRVVFLGSGSAGNAVAVSDAETTVLIDCGFSAREAARRMTIAGLDAGRVCAILVTHEHSDHIRGVEVFARRHVCAVYATHGTRRAAGLDAMAADVRGLVPGEVERIGTFLVVPFRTSHDAIEPVGFRIESDAGERLGLVTDTGVLTPEAAEGLQGVDLLGIESNHDIAMLDGGPYPHFLKQRIRSDRGHLSNACAADALERLASGRLRRVFALHRSAINNTGPLAEAALAMRARSIGLDVPVEVVSQHTPSDSGFRQAPLFAAAAGP